MGDKLTASQVEHVAELANLPITTSETSQFQKQLSEVVEYVGKIAKLKTQIAKRERKSVGKKAREDVIEAENCLTQEEAISNAKNVHNGLFVAPAVFGEK